ncbi:MAG: DALR anticodon-binding domain-containing protein, partial [Christensenellales bacterium]
ISLLEKAGGFDAEKADFAGLDNPESEAVASILAGFGDVLREAVRKYEPCCLARYLVDLCKEYNRFYLAHRISGEEEGVKNARAMLTAATHYVLEEGLRLLGIDAPQKM